MSKATALAHPNIALVKYWGKRDVGLNLPAAPSLSLTLAGMETRTTVEFDASLGSDHAQINGAVLRGPRLARLSDFLERVRQMSGEARFAKIVSENTFPTAAGLASSASGFAALAAAATQAAGLDLNYEELSVLARLGSGSAARSVLGGFVEMRAGERADGQDSFAVPVADVNHWDLRCLVAITAEGEKSVGSTDGMMDTMLTSNYYDAWIAGVYDDMPVARQAVIERDFMMLAAVAERSCLRMHASAMAADPGILYWNPTTVRLIHRIRRARKDGLPVFFTIDAGPHVKVFCQASDRSAVEAILKSTEGVLGTLSTRPGGGVVVL